jgi:hypothetical protein
MNVALNQAIAGFLGLPLVHVLTVRRAYARQRRCSMSLSPKDARSAKSRTHIAAVHLELHTDDAQRWMWPLH